MPPPRGKCKRRLDTSSNSANSSLNTSNRTNILTQEHADTDDEASDSDISHFCYSSPENPMKADKTEAEYYRAMERRCSLSLNTKQKNTGKNNSREQQRRRDRSLPSRQTKQLKKRVRMNNGLEIMDTNASKVNGIHSVIQQLS